MLQCLLYLFLCFTEVEERETRREGETRREKKRGREEERDTVNITIVTKEREKKRNRGMLQMIRDKERMRECYKFYKR